MMTEIEAIREMRQLIRDWETKGTTIEERFGHIESAAVQVQIAKATIDACVDDLKTLLAAMEKNKNRGLGI